MHSLERLPAFCPRLTPDIRGKARAEASAEVVGWLGDRQHGVLARRQLVAAGLDGRWVERRLAAGRLVTVHRGVYAVGSARLTRDGQLAAAALAGGAGAVVGLRSAGELLRVRDGGGRAVDVLVPDHRRGPRGLALRATRDLRPEDVTSVRGIPCTTFARTTLDLAGLEPPSELRRLIASGRRLGILDESALRAQLPRHRGHPGAAELTRLVGLLADRTESELEDAFLALVRRSGLPLPEVNHRWDAAGRWVRTDFRWPGAGVVVEVDGFGTHGGRAAFEEDAERALALWRAGVELLRFTHRQVHETPAAVVDALSIVLARRSARD